jgi:hypothetical protein
LRSDEIRRVTRLISSPVRLSQVLAVRAATTSAITGQRVLTAAIVSGIAYVAMPIPRLIGVEMVEPLLPALRERTMVAVVRIKAVVDVAIKAAWAMKPRAGSDEYAANKPVGPIVAVRGALVWSVIEVSIRTYRRWSNIHADGNLGLHRGSQA